MTISRKSPSRKRKQKTVWIRFEPTAFSEGTFDLTLEQRGAYISILCLLYNHDNCIDIRDEYARLARRIGVSKNRCKRLCSELVDLGKLHIAYGQIYNDRVGDEIKRADDIRKSKIPKKYKNSEKIGENLSGKVLFFNHSKEDN